VSRRVYVYFLLTFLLGIIAGGAGVYHWALHTGHWHSDFDQKRIVRRMAADLKLDDSQVQQISTILDDYFKKRKELDQKHAPEVDALRQQTRNQIRQLLNPEQLAKFDEHVRRTDERIKRERTEGK